VRVFDEVSKPLSDEGERLKYRIGKVNIEQPSCDKRSDEGDMRARFRAAKQKGPKICK
jgi:hypothetical protein